MGTSKSAQQKKEKEIQSIHAQRVKKKPFEECIKKNLSLDGIYSKDKSEIESVYDVKENLDSQYQNSTGADIAMVIDTTLYKKYTKVIQNSIYALLNDFKKYFMEVDPTFSNPSRLFLIHYSNTFASISKSFDFTKQNELIEYLDSIKEDTKSQEFGTIAAVNNIDKIDFKEDNARFVFHFCLGSSDEDCKTDLSSATEITEELRNKNLKYEIIFFNDQLNKDFFTKLQEMIEVDVNIIATV